jgi:hypothetical protein
LNQIDAIARTAGMSVTKLSYSFSAKQQAETGTVQIVEVSMSTESSFDQLVQFLDLVENAARVVTMTNLRYTYDNKETLVYNSTFNLESPYLMIESAAVTDEPIYVDIFSPEFTGFMDKVKGYTYYESNVPLFPIPLENQQLNLEDENNPVILDAPSVPTEALVTPTTPPSTVPAPTTPVVTP